MSDEEKKEGDLYICERCGMVFETIHGLNTHIGIKHLQKPQGDCDVNLFLLIVLLGVMGFLAFKFAKNPRT